MELTTQLRLMFLVGLIGVAAVAVGLGLVLSWLVERGTRGWRSLPRRSGPIANGGANRDGRAPFSRETETERPPGRTSRAA